MHWLSHGDVAYLGLLCRAESLYGLGVVAPSRWREHGVAALRQLAIGREDAPHRRVLLQHIATGKLLHDQVAQRLRQRRLHNQTARTEGSHFAHSPTQERSMLVRV